MQKFHTKTPLDVVGIVPDDIENVSLYAALVLSLIISSYAWLLLIIANMFGLQVDDWDYLRDGLQYARVLLLFKVPLKGPQPMYYTEETEVACAEMAYIHCFNDFAESTHANNILKPGGIVIYWLLRVVILCYRWKYWQLGDYCLLQVVTFSY